MHKILVKKRCQIKDDWKNPISIFKETTFDYFVASLQRPYYAVLCKISTIEKTGIEVRS